MELLVPLTPLQPQTGTAGPPLSAAEQHETTTTLPTMMMTPVPIGEAHDERASWPPTPTAAARASARTWLGFYKCVYVWVRFVFRFVMHVQCAALVFVGISTPGSK